MSAIADVVGRRYHLNARQTLIFFSHNDELDYRGHGQTGFVSGVYIWLRLALVSFHSAIRDFTTP